MCVLDADFQNNCSNPKDISICCTKCKADENNAMIQVSGRVQLKMTDCENDELEDHIVFSVQSLELTLNWHDMFSQVRDFFLSRTWPCCSPCTPFEPTAALPMDHHRVTGKWWMYSSEWWTLCLESHISWWFFQLERVAVDELIKYKTLKKMYD